MQSQFSKRVKACVARIPKGKVMTYGAVAAAAGSPGGARAVGSVMSGNYDPKVPCHRVVRADGVIGEYNRGGRGAKAKRLLAEGVTVRGGRVARECVIA